jgi:hypothetical protein
MSNLAPPSRRVRLADATFGFRPQTIALLSLLTEDRQAPAFRPGSTTDQVGYK